MTRAGIYLRISKGDPIEQTATSRQRADCTAYAERQGWEVVDEFEDVDLSAYKKNVRRPQFERMIDAVRSREIDCVLAWHIDRVTRQRSTFVRLMDALEDADGFLATATDGIDTRTNAGQFMADVLVSHARMSSDDASRRLKRKHLELAEAGRPIGGGARPFGYTRDRIIVPDEAKLIREAVQRVFAGDGLISICKDWKRREIFGVSGAEWAPGTLKRMLTGAVISGQRAHRDQLYPGTWEPIISTDDTLRLRAVLNEPSRWKSMTNARSYLLTGFLRCDLCGAKLIARRGNGGKKRYICANIPGSQGGCGKIARASDPVDELVKRAVLMRLDSADLAEYVSKPTDTTAETHTAVEADEQALQELSQDYYVDKAITRVEYFAVREALDARIEANKRKLAQTNGHGVLNGFVGAGGLLADQWDSLHLDKQRAIIGAVIGHIDILPAQKGRTTFDPSLVRITWKV